MMKAGDEDNGSFLDRPGAEFKEMGTGFFCLFCFDKNKTDLISASAKGHSYSVHYTFS